jgi:hypothetical protein
LVYWVHNYLVEQTGRQFIGSHSGGVQFRKDALATGEEEGYWRISLVAFTVASSSATTRRANVSHSGVVNVPRHMVKGREVSIFGEHIRSNCDLLGYDGWSKIVARVYPRRDIYGPPVLSN